MLLKPKNRKAGQEFRETNAFHEAETIRRRLFLRAGTFHKLDLYPPQDGQSRGKNPSSAGFLM